MSKAFTREDDAAEDPPLPPRPSATLPPGVKNYLTADGARRLRAELDRLAQVERPRIAALPEAEDVRPQLRRLDQLMLQLHESLQSAEIVSRPANPESRVRFGATVTVRHADGRRSQYRLVGVDETEPERGWVSWRSPIARALLHGSVGQRVRFQFPAGEEELEILAMTHEGD